MKNVLAVTFVSVAVATMASPSVVFDSVASGDPWSTVTVNYTLSGADDDIAYKVAFDITANGVKKGVTNVAAKVENMSYTKVIDTAALFGAATTDPKAKVGVSLIAVKSFGGVQLWENGPYWAECNVGANKPEEYGYYFWWGDTVGYKRNAADDGWVSAKDGTEFEFSSGNCQTYDMTKPELQSDGYIDSTGNLVAAHDAATAHLGAPWRMPTYAEMSALISNCDTTWTTRGGVYGRLVTGRGAYASKSIFLPAAGSGYHSNLYLTGSGGGFWSSTPHSDESDYAWLLEFGSIYFRRGKGGRYFGKYVRPLRGFAQ